MSEQNSPPPGRAAFAFIFVTILLDMLALGIIIPVLPSLVVGFMGGDTAGSAEVLRIFGTAWALMRCCCRRRSARCRTVSDGGR